MQNDKRYTIGLEFTGHPSGVQQHVARFCGEFIGSASMKAGAKILIAEHVAKRGFDLVARYDSGDSAVLWLKRGKSYRVVYGAEIYDSKSDIDAAHRFGEFVRHSAECAGLLD